ncbi:MAG: hypothetical protein GXW85_01920 [Clostridia bacterium]|nr:hypothetical protein [Clostridia bacterium]
MENLDRLCAEYGYKFAKQVSKGLGNSSKAAETFITKALGVLQEQGLYALLLFCKSRGDNEKGGAVKVEELTKEILREKLKFINDGDILEEINGLLSRLDDLILAIQVLEKTLIYARFHAKAMKKEGEELK